MTAEKGRHLAFPFRIGSDGRTVQAATLEEHIRDELVQLLLTSPGERAFLPQLGGGARQLVFGSANDVTADMARVTITSAISTWLGHRVSIEDLSVSVENETLEINVMYRITETGDARTIAFRREEA